MTLKQAFGRWLFPRLPVNRHVFDHVRCELNAIWVRTLHRVHPAYLLRAREIRQRQNVLLNVGCGPFGLAGWVNLDLFPFKGVTIRADCRNNFPIGNGACTGIHVEHYFEHLTHEEEAPRFLEECRRCLTDGGVLRIIVPDAGRFARAYADDGWASLEALAAAGTSMQKGFPTKMDALSHVMVQGYEHFGGYDFETLALALRNARFHDITQCTFRTGRFPDGCIDREQHSPYSLYVEAVNRPASGMDEP